jgi:alpha-1,3-rhamnosyltransferase
VDRFFRNSLTASFTLSYNSDLMVAPEVEEQYEQQAVETVPTVSVVVPSFNHAQYIEFTLRSIMKQTLSPSELIVIDDGSSDDSVAVVERVLSDCHFPCELLVRKNRGLSVTLNEGLERSRGRYFAYLGSDDVWLPGFLAARISLLESRPEAVLAYGHAYFIDEDNRIIDSTSDWATYLDGDVREMLLRRTTAPMSPTVVYRRKALDQQRWNETSKLEDYDLYLRLGELGSFAFDPQPLSAWRWHSANTSWDQEFMLREQLKSQRDAALRSGWTDKEVEALQRTTRFSRAEDFLRVGEKSKALSLMLNNLGGANAKLARMLLRLLIPTSIMKRRQRARQQAAFERYGKLEI